MPPRKRRDISEDLKRAVLLQIQAGTSYRKISALTGLSVGAVAAINKYVITCHLSFFGWKAYCVVFLQKITNKYFVYFIASWTLWYLFFRNKCKLGLFRQTERTVVGRWNLPHDIVDSLKSPFADPQRSPAENWKYSCRKQVWRLVQVQWGDIWRRWGWCHDLPSANPCWHIDIAPCDWPSPGSTWTKDQIFGGKCCSLMKLEFQSGMIATKQEFAEK